MGEVVLALLEGRDPSEADRRAVNIECQWRFRTVWFYSNADVREDTGKVVFIAVSDRTKNNH